MSTEKSVNSKMSDIKKSKARRAFLLWLTFMKIGAFTFGGGYAMIPLIQKETVEKHGWITGEDILDIIAIAESTPGPIAVNMATFVGFKVAGFFGAAAATFGVILPSFLIIFAVSYVLRMFEELQCVKYAFFGIRAGVTALIVKALWSMYKQCEKGAFQYFIMAAAFVSVAFFDVNVLCVIFGCALFGLLRSALNRRRGK